MNTHLKQLWAAMKLPKNFKKSYKFFCLGLDIRVSEIVQADGLDAGRFATLLHLLAEVMLGEGEQPIGRVRLVQGVQVHPEHICQLRRDGQHTAALRRLRLCHDLFAVDRLEALVDRERALLQVDVCRSQGQQLTDAQARPEQNGQAGSAWELRHVLDNLRELVHRPEFHFIRVLFADAARHLRGVPGKAVILAGVVEHGG